MTSGIERARVVAVDDTRFYREVARSTLEGLARVETCASAEEALEALAREAADLVVSDLELPGLSGTELLERVRREHPGTEFVVMTGHASVESAVEALRMGAADYLRKPVEPAELALVVERALTRRRLLRENAHLRGVLSTVEACRSLTPCLEPGEIYPSALDLLLRSLSRARGLALFRRSPRSHPDGVAFRGLSEGQAARLRRIFVEEKSVDVDEVAVVELSSGSPVHDVLREAGVEVGRLLAVPIHGEEREAGVLWVFEDERPFGEGELERAMIVQSHATLSLRNAERYAQAKERAFIDDCTEAYNARYLLEATTREIRRAERYGSELSVLFLDLDRFKLVNDRHGHLVGSQVLRRLAGILSECVRQVDTLARYGGDEFTILLVDTGADSARAIAERIRRTVERSAFETGGGPPVHVTISIGVATYPRDGRTREELLDTSDKAMYRAKSQGRNRVCAADEL
jgi:two-component system cell cycle response regulator